MKRFIEGWRKFLTETIEREDYLDYAEEVARAYEARPVRDKRVIPSYKSLIKSNNILYKRLQSRIDIEFTPEYAPDNEIGYSSTEEMIRRVEETGKLMVDTKYSDNHPVFSQEQNWKFRAVHDAYTHYQRGKKISGMKFDLRGELQTYNLHKDLAPNSARAALFSEVVGQVCYEITTGNFPDPQKACYLFGFDFKHVGEIDREKYKKNFMPKYDGEPVENDL